MLQYLCIFAICFFHCKAAEWFGSSNQYRCHCQTGCNSDGFCVNNGNCDIGWFGFKCQYRNLAVSDTRITPSFFESTPSQYQSIIADGDNTTCINNAGLKSLYVSWSIAFHFTWLRMKLNTNWIKDITIIFKNSNLSTTTIVCANQSEFEIDSTTVDVHCDLNVAIKYIEITGDIVKSICDISISGGKNVALKGTAEQSTTWGQGTMLDGYFVASRAVDGYLNRNFISPYYTSTTEGNIPGPDLNPYWTVRLNTSFVVNRYMILNRQAAEDRLQHFTLNSVDANKNEVFNFTDIGTSALVTYMINDVNNNAVSQVTIKQTKKGYPTDICPIISIAEVEVYGECPSGKWGLDCASCNDNCYGKCNVDGGWCDSSCQGYSNPPKCDIPCIETFWGFNCRQICSSNCDRKLCRATSGQCTMGCIEGFQTLNCTVACDKGTYGKNCSFSCSDNCIDHDCDNKNGTCFSCVPGYSGDKCNQSCDKGTYGKNCSFSCSDNCINHDCDSKNGTCFSCVPGYSGDKCNQSCDKGTYGKNCSFFCSDNCINHDCDNKNGTCFSCVPGYSGDKCNQSCDKGTYGKNCSFFCSDNCINHDCDSKNGTCFSCVPGYSGDKCDQLSTIESDSFNSQTEFGKIFGAGFGAGFGVALILAIVYMITMHKLKKKQSMIRKPTQVYDLTEKQGNDDENYLKINSQSPNDSTDYYQNVAAVDQKVGSVYENIT